MKFLHLKNLEADNEELDIVWRPSSQKSILERSNPNFMRTLQLTDQGLFLIKGKAVCGVSIPELIKLFVSSHPELTYKPEVKVTALNGVATVAYKSETPATIQWQVSDGQSWSDLAGETGESYMPTGSLVITFRAKVTNATGESFSPSQTYTPVSTYQVS